MKLFINPHIIQPVQKSNTVYLLNLVSNKYSEINTHFTFPEAMGLLQDDEKLYIVGGQDKSQRLLKDCYICFNLLLNFKQIAYLNEAKKNVSLIKLDDDKIASIGGVNEQGTSEC